MKRELEQIIERNFEEQIKQTMLLCAIPSLRAAALADAPFGREIQKALDFSLALASDLGFETYNDEGYAGHAQAGPMTQDPLGILVHLDVVPPGAAPWQTPPFSPQIRDGKLYARGAMDDKGPAVASLFALRAVMLSGTSLKRGVRIVLGCDEESKWEDIKHYRQHVGLPSQGFSPDGQFPVVFAEKGILHADILFEGSQDPSVIEISSGGRPNMVPAEAYVHLRGTPRASWTTQAQKAGIITEETHQGMKFIATGISAHASRPQEGKNAWTSLADFLWRNRMVGDDLGQMCRCISENFMGYYAENTPLAMTDPISGRLTVNVGCVRRTPQGMVLTLDIRYPVSMNVRDIMRALRKTVAGHPVRIRSHKAPLHVPKDSHLVKTLCKVYTQVMGQTADPVAIGGGTYARALSCGVAFGAQFPDTVDTAHQTDEFVTLADLFRMTVIYAKAIIELCS